jgi:plasmid stabilization system protein ParE
LDSGPPIEADDEFWKQAKAGIRTRRNRRLKTMRSWIVRSLRNYIIFYIPTPSGIRIIRILHGARDLDSIFDE